MTVPADFIRQAGAVVFRGTEDYEVLLVRARRTPQWIFPKGHVEPDESAEEAALREAREEAGVTGRIVARLEPILSFEWAGNEYRVEYFLVECLEAGHPHEPRAQMWRGPEDALEHVNYDELKQVVRAASTELERRRAWYGGEGLR